MKRLKTKYFEEINDGRVSNKLLQMLDKAREKSGIAFVITSAFRTLLENRRVGGVRDSSHLKGLAVDIRVRNSRERWIILKALIEVGFTRIGIGKGFIHVDIDKEKREELIWLY